MSIMQSSSWQESSPRNLIMNHILFCRSYRVFIAFSVLTHFYFNAFTLKYHKDLIMDCTSVLWKIEIKKNIVWILKHCYKPMIETGNCVPSFAKSFYWMHWRSGVLKSNKSSRDILGCCGGILTVLYNFQLPLNHRQCVAYIFGNNLASHSQQT